VTYRNSFVDPSSSRVGVVLLDSFFSLVRCEKGVTNLLVPQELKRVRRTQPTDLRHLAPIPTSLSPPTSWCCRSSGCRRQQARQLLLRLARMARRQLMAMLVASVHSSHINPPKALRLIPTNVVVHSFHFFLAQSQRIVAVFSGVEVKAGEAVQFHP
jgi:hypothetical protein